MLEDLLVSRELSNTVTYFKTAQVPMLSTNAS